LNATVEVGPRVTLESVPDLPLVAPGDDLAELLCARTQLRDGDIIVVASKLVSRAEGRFVDAADVVVSDRARAVAVEVDKEPWLVELILQESVGISRQAPGVLIVRHRLGFVSANAAIDRSNVGGHERVLLLPKDPDASASALRDRIGVLTGASVAVILSDSFGRPFRIGTVGVAIGVAGLPAVWDQRGGTDLHGRVLEHTVTALADQVAAAADLVAGQAGEGRGAIVVRGIAWSGAGAAADLQRPPGMDLYA
jgi:coenzyme F420-0:L-glutamate ligase / coenzyme F420-1:gamma-L-glutamate ligase